MHVHGKLGVGVANIESISLILAVRKNTWQKNGNGVAVPTAGVYAVGDIMNRTYQQVMLVKSKRWYRHMESLGAISPIVQFNPDN